MLLCFTKKTIKTNHNLHYDRQDGRKQLLNTTRQTGQTMGHEAFRKMQKKILKHIF